MSGQRDSLLPATAIAQRIHIIRGHRIVLDEDLAEIYGVPTRRLNEQVKRNLERFPCGFMFQLTAREWTDLKSQFATSSWGGRRTAPFAFTEHGAVMAASILNSPEAVEASIFVIRAFIAMRDALASSQVLARKLLELERKVGGDDETIEALISALRQLMEPPAPKKRKIGFGEPE